MTAPPRPGLLTFGLVANMIHAGLMVLATGLATIAALGAFGLSLAALPVFQVWPASLLLSLGALVLMLYLGFYLFVLVVCVQSWNGSRPWLWTLVVLSVVGLVNTGPLSFLIGVLTIVGALQYLDALPRQSEAT